MGRRKQNTSLGTSAVKKTGILESMPSTGPMRMSSSWRSSMSDCNLLGVSQLFKTFRSRSIGLEELVKMGMCWSGRCQSCEIEMAV